MPFFFRSWGTFLWCLLLSSLNYLQVSLKGAAVGISYSLCLLLWLQAPPSDHTTVAQMSTFRQRLEGERSFRPKVRKSCFCISHKPGVSSAIPWPPDPDTRTGSTLSGGDSGGHQRFSTDLVDPVVFTVLFVLAWQD